MSLLPAKCVTPVRGSPTVRNRVKSRSFVFGYRRLVRTDLTKSSPIVKKKNVSQEKNPEEQPEQPGGRPSCKGMEEDDGEKVHPAAPTSPRPRPTRKACAGEQCNRHAYYGLPGGKPIFCAMHKEVGYVNVHNKMCSRQGCYKRPHYGNVGGKAVSCVTHKLPGERWRTQGQSMCVDI